MSKISALFVLGHFDPLWERGSFTETIMCVRKWTPIFWSLLDSSLQGALIAPLLNSQQLYVGIQTALNVFVDDSYIW